MSYCTYIIIDYSEFFFFVVVSYLREDIYILLFFVIGTGGNVTKYELIGDLHYLRQC